MLEKTILGASLYVPATHKDLGKIANGELLSELRSLIFCTEDAVADREFSFAMFNLSLTLQQMSDRPKTGRYVRVRNPETLERVLEMPGSKMLDGFVLPKATSQNFDHYFHQIRKTDFKLMPTLETVEAFDESEMKLFRQCLERPGVRDHITALRIGGNDLLAILGVRRPRNMTIYKTPLGPVISRLATTFLPYGFSLTSPVFEHLDCEDILATEMQEDIAHGMSGKTAIHPSQVPQIENHYRVSQSDMETALKIIDPTSPGVFKFSNSMCEIATHRTWAYGVIAQAKLFGINKSSTIT